MPILSAPLRRRGPLGLAALILAGFLSACAASSSSADGTAPRRSSTVITEEEFDSVVTIGSLWEAIARLRAPWLRSRGGRSGYPVVFVNGTRFGELDSLRAIQVTDVASARLVSAGDATTLYGTGYPAGIIDVRTHR
jgi:hypothetical protein